MIIYPAAFILSEAAAGRPLSYPRIGWSTYTFALLPSAITVSTETTNGPKDAPLRPETAEYWLPSALPATWEINLGVTRAVDYVGIAGHTIGSSGAAAEVRWSADVADFNSYLSLPGTAGNYASTPDSAANSITGDIDLRGRAALDDWTPAGTNTLLNKYTESGNQRAYLLQVLTDGKLRLIWSADGTAIIIKDSTVTAGVTDGAAKWVRATLDVDNGAAGNDVKFYTSDDYNADTGAGTWAQLGATVTTAVATSIFNATAPLIAGGFNAGTSNLLAGKIYHAEVRNGINGAVVAKFRPDDGLNGATSFTSGTGEVWTINQSGSPPATLVMKRFASGIMPANDAPLLFLDASRSARYLRLSLTGGAVMPRIAVIYIGEILAMEREIEAPYTPLNLSRQTVLHRSLSRGGQFLGQGFRRNGVVGSASFRHLDPDWYRTEFDPFVEHARNLPYFFGWYPETYPKEVAFVWSDKDIAPSYMGNQWVQVQWNMVGQAGTRG